MTTNDIMNGSADLRRDSLNSPPMSPPPPPSGHSQQPQHPQQRIYFNHRGEKLSHSQFQELLNEVIGTKRQGGRVSASMQHEALWMLSQHEPNHPLIHGKHVPPPVNTNPTLLGQMYTPQQIQKMREHYMRQRQQQQQRQREQQQRAPNAMSPNMIPSDSVMEARRAGIPMTIDPALANASAGMGPQSWRPSAQMSPQRPSSAAFSPAQPSPYMPSPGLGPRPASAQSIVSSQPQYSKQAQAQHQPQSAQSMSGAHRALSLDQMVDTGLKRVEHFWPSENPRTMEWLGSNPTIERKKDFLKQLNARMQVMVAKRPKAQQARAMSLSGNVIDLTRNKHKEPPTAAQQSISERQQIDLTIDKVPRVKLPRQEQVSERGRLQAPVSLKTPGGQNINVVPVPEHIAPDALCSHAQIHGVNMHNVELNDTIYHDQTALISQHSAERQAAIASLDPSPEELRSMKKADAEQQLPIYTFEAEPTIATAARKVKSGTFNFSWSAENEELSRPASDEELVRIGCKEDEDGRWRAPSAESVTQERANLEWELLGQGDRVYSC